MLSMASTIYSLVRKKTLNEVLPCVSWSDYDEACKMFLIDYPVDEVILMVWEVSDAVSEK